MATNLAAPTDDSRTPTAAHFTESRSSTQQPPSIPDTQMLETPTRDTFNTSEKRPLSPGLAAAEMQSMPPPASTSSLNRADSHGSSGQQDINMEEDGDDQEESDNEGTVDGSERPAKKKRSQRFFCTEYPPCNLSFTRSEHLARHIRKHTGERPFQCHCLRRFSRLDNLRQHAQTVHVNEEIPVDSLAATGTRFQRQIRTDRIRPTGGHSRQRNSTVSSGSHSRGHSRNISSSSIGSVSDFGSPEDPRRRPQPLAMAQTPPRPGLSVNTFDVGGVQAPYYNYSPSGYSTPTSVFSADPGSPRMPFGLGSPIAMMPRSTIGWGGQNHGRRLSVPSGVSPYHAQPHAYPPSNAPFMSPPSGSSASSVFGSPTQPHFHHGHSESIDATMEADWRRRTWHPSTRTGMESRPATSGLSYHQRPDDPSPVSTTQPAAQQALRLPGIDSFDRAHVQPAPPRRLPGEMEVDEASQVGETEPSSKRDSWSSMNQNLNQLDLTQGTPPRDPALWRHSTGAVPLPQSGFRTGNMRAAPPQPLDLNSANPPELPADQPSTPKKKKRQGWYMGVTSPQGTAGPGPAVRTSPDGSSGSDELQTPATSTAEYRPAIMHSDGFIEGQPGGVIEEHQKGSVRPDIPSFPTDQHQGAKHEDTGRLDALVAVATSSDQAFAHPA